MERESIKCWQILTREWVNFRAGDCKTIGVFFSYEDARSYLEETIDRTTKDMKSDALLKGYSITTYWDNESNCDNGASITCESKTDDDEYCYDFEIEQVDLFADWSKIVRSPISFLKKLNVLGKESA